MSCTRCVLQVISLRFCYILLRDKIKLAGSALLYDFDAERCENKHYEFTTYWKSVQVRNEIIVCKRQQRPTNMDTRPQ